MGITNKDYFEPDKYMSVSRYKKLKKCELLGTKPWEDFKKSKAMLIGSYVDAYVEGTLDKFKESNPEIYVKNATDAEKLACDIFEKMLYSNPSYYLDLFPSLFTKKGALKKNNSIKNLLYAIRSNNDVLEDILELVPEFNKPQLLADFNKAEEICEFIDNDAWLLKYLSGEKQKIMTGEISKVPFKIMMDSYIPETLIADLKVMRTITDSEGNYYNFLTQYGYITQLACYQEIVRQNTGNVLPVYIVAVTKETPINSVIIQVPQNLLDLEIGEVEEKVQRLYDVFLGKEEPIGCGKCKACIEARNETELISLDDIYGKDY